MILFVCFLTVIFYLCSGISSKKLNVLPGFSFYSNLTTLCSQTLQGQICVSAERNRQIYCSNATNNCVSLKCSLQGVQQINVMLANGTILTQDYFVSNSYYSAINHFIEIARPPFGNIEHSTLDVSLIVDDSQYSHVKVEVIGLLTQVLPSTSLVDNALVAHQIEPASWFFSVAPSAGVFDNQLTFGLPTPGYLEFTLSPTEIFMSRWFADPLSQSGVRDYHSSLFKINRAPTTVCIWTLNGMDGQKKIWLQQTQHLSSGKKFRFVWGLSLSPDVSIEDEQHPDLQSRHNVYHYLKTLQKDLPGLRIIESPFNKQYAVSESEMSEKPSDGSPSAAEANPTSTLDVYRYIHQRLVAADYKLDRVTPVWCRKYYANMIEVLQQEQCDISVYGNSRGFSYNVFITDAARLLGIPTVAELNNMYVDSDILPNVFVAASEFASEHDSIRGIKRALEIQNKDDRAAGSNQHLLIPDTVVISPSIDSQSTFNPALYPAVHKSDGVRFFKVGFISRLSPEKSPGLFLQAAYELIQLYPLAKFVIVGEGELRPSLEELVQRLEIEHAVTFLGWLSDRELAAAIGDLDVVVNPSQRPETFCIANTEVMSMGVPLITFGVGGIGEYVRQPTQGESRLSSNSSLYSVSSNAVLLNTATPEAIAEAVHFLVRNPEIRRSLGAEGRRTVKALFSVDRQMEQYTKLYEYWSQFPFTLKLKT